MCSANNAGKGPYQYWLTSLSYRAAPAARGFVLTWGVSASLAHHSPAHVLSEDVLDAVQILKAVLEMSCALQKTTENQM